MADPHLRPELFLRLYLAPDAMLGPGKAALLAALAEYQLLYLSGISLAVLILNVALPVLARRRYLQDEARRLRREKSK